MRLQSYITESKLSRIWQFVEDDKKSFAVVSVFRGEYSKKQNEERHIDLKDMLRKEGYGFIEMKGGYREDRGFVNEKSIFIPNISRKRAIEIGVTFEQESILFKDDKEFVSIDTRDNIGSILKHFVKSSKSNNILLAKDAIKDFFSELLKGSHRGKKFTFNSIHIQEKTYVGHIDRMGGKTPEWINIWDCKAI